jgi:hypothetical protein
MAGQQGQNWALDLIDSIAFPEAAAAKTSRKPPF